MKASLLIVKLTSIPWNMLCLCVTLVDSIILVRYSCSFYLDFTNTLAFIVKIGDVGEAKTVFRTHISSSDKVTSNDV